jgi:FO synthase subunit 2
MSINKMDISSATELEKFILNIDSSIAKILNIALSGKDISPDQAFELLESRGLEYQATLMVADELRRQTVGDMVTYVVNRNINFTNVCVKRCGFCAFSRDHREEQGYFLPTEMIVEKAKQAYKYGATEVCVQAGLPPKMEGDLYVKICESIKKELPDIHVHGFSPEEVLYGSIRSKSSIESYLNNLKDAGVGSLPGTSAEILDQEIRDKISPGRITKDQWIEVIKTAHKLGIPTTSTIMFGHVENNMHIANHIDTIRNIQRETHGFTEFVPLSFVSSEAPMSVQKSIPDIRMGATGTEVMKVHAVSRIMLNNHIPNIQASWVKEGDKMSQLLLNAGVNDLGGTLINESISTSAGAMHGQLMKPSTFRDMIRSTGRIPAERYTDYKIKRIYDNDDTPKEPLDLIDGNAEEIFGSYNQLANMKEHRFIHPSLKSLSGKV